MKGYKAFNSDLTCRGFQYEIGGTYTLEDPDSLEICERGFHFCPDIANCYRYYPTREATRICEVEALGEIQKSSDNNKMATNKIKIIREITGPEKRGNLIEQAGYCNVGESNTGNWNTGDRNTGDFNTGHSNSGNRNTGDCNAGEYNSGDWNIGDRNAGDWNSGNHNSGCFNTDRDPTIKMFDKPSNWTMIDWRMSEARVIVLSLYRDTGDRQVEWNELSEKDKATVMSLPNFDADIFYECTGIRVE